MVLLEVGDSALDAVAIAGFGLLGLVVGAVVSILVSLIVRLIIRRREGLSHLSRRLKIPQRVFLLTLGAGTGVSIAITPSALQAAPPWQPVFMHIFGIVTILTGTLLVTGVIRAVEDTLLHQRQTAHETPHYRRVRTQMQIVTKVLVAVAWICAGAGVLLTFEQFRAIGTSLFASAGVASLLIGLAAQSSLANVFAGMQIVFSDALRVDDVVVIESEMGHIEEITLTYVVVRTWDDRRWIVPSTYFTTKRFENWTRQEPKLLGTVEFDLDWLVPVEAMRIELKRIVQASDLWDGRTVSLQVTEATGGPVRVRAVVSAPSSGTLWDLRCHVREELITWVQRNAVYALPRYRVEPDTTTAPPVQERQEFVDETITRWEREQADRIAEKTTTLLPAITDEPKRQSLPRSWLQALRQQRAAAQAARGDLPRADSDQTSARREAPDAGDAPQSADARLYSGSPEAEERNRQLSGPSAADMAERGTADHQHDPDERATAG